MATHSSILAWKIAWIEEPGSPSMGRLDGGMDIRLWQGGAHSWVNVPVTQLQCVCVGGGGFQYSQAIL